MERLVLTKEVSITGPDFFGPWWGLRKSPTVTLRPAGKPGWFWRVAGGEEIPITPDLLAKKWRRLQLAFGHDQFNEWEHWGFMRLLGLDEVVIECDRPWPPFGRSGELFLKCEKVWKRSGKLQPFTIPREIASHQKTGVRYIEYAPTEEDTLAVRVKIDYPGLGEYEETFSLPPKSVFDMECLAATKTQGWPRWFYRVSRLARCFLRWPHHDKIFWPQENDPAIALMSFARHRFLDLLGALSVLCPPGEILTGKIYSQRGGHKTDVGLVGEADCLLHQKAEIEEIVSLVDHL